MGAEIKDRNHEVLRAIVLDYMRTVAPVSSRQITDRYELGCSPATVRNVMAELEEQGYLEQPHASAGRVPTDKALRFYVDRLPRAGEASAEDRARVDRAVAESFGIADLVRGAGRILSVTSHYAGVASAPSGAAAACERVEFVRLAERRILALFLMNSRVLYSGVVETEEDYAQETLERFARSLNPILEGLGLHAVRDRMLRELENERARFDRALAAALRLGAGRVAR
ncbi:MAG: heat-inducible transcriptional repressor HrcA, partial [Candidatus Methylomirabilis sp.]|nr:heat-inducible transcriptional repressor HrcA [Deltaproteobacteria bacterium]